MSEPRTYTIYVCPHCFSDRHPFGRCSTECRDLSGTIPAMVPLTVVPLADVLAALRQEQNNSYLEDAYNFAADFIEREVPSTGEDNEERVIDGE